MGRIKGCINKECKAHHRQIRYMEDDFFCSKCGHELYYVCIKCFKVLEENTDDKYCADCRHKKDVQAQKYKDDAKKVADALKAVGPIAIEVAKNPKVQQKVKPIIKKVMKK